MPAYGFPHQNFHPWGLGNAKSGSGRSLCPVRRVRVGQIHKNRSHHHGEMKTNRGARRSAQLVTT